MCAFSPLFGYLKCQYALLNRHHAAALAYVDSTRYLVRYEGYCPYYLAYDFGSTQGIVTGIFQENVGHEPNEISLVFLEVSRYFR